MDEVEIKCAYTKLVPIAELKPYKRNRNNHPPEQIERLAKLIKNHGLRHPVIVSKLSGEVIAGNGRLDALKRLGVKKVPVDFQEFTDADAEYAFSVSDNAVALWAELDLSGINADIPDLGPFDIELLGIKNFEIEVADKEGLTDEDAIPEKVEPRTKLGDIYQLGPHRLMCGDSTSPDDLSRLLGDCRADMVFCSPPYGVGLDYNGYDDSFTNTRQVVEDVLTAVSVFVDGYICLNWGDIVSGRVINKTEFPSQFSWLPIYDEILRRCGFFLWGQRIWAKPHARVSAPWSASSNRPVTDWEYLFTWSNGKQVRKERGDDSHFGVIDTGSSSQTDTLDKHPGAFPVMVADRMVTTHTKHGGRVLEPFCGTGTTLIACEKSGRNGYGMEIDPHYCDIAVARWEQFTGQKAELLNG